MEGTWFDWVIGDAAADADFAPPKLNEDLPVFGSYKELMEVEMQEEMKAQNPALGLTGMPAPDFELELFEGGKFKLSDQKGKHTVLLDFWASWCQPCREAMPQLIKAAEALKDQGVLLVSVNLMEDKATVSKFLEETGLKVPVALDVEGSVGEKYKVRGIPQTVIIGDDGEIKQVHVGFSDDLEAQMTAELVHILSKEPAAEEEAAPAP